MDLLMMHTMLVCRNRSRWHRDHTCWQYRGVGADLFDRTRCGDIGECSIGYSFSRTEEPLRISMKVNNSPTLRTRKSVGQPVIGISRNTRRLAIFEIDKQPTRCWTNSTVRGVPHGLTLSRDALWRKTSRLPWSRLGDTRACTTTRELPALGSCDSER